MQGGMRMSNLVTHKCFGLPPRVAARSSAGPQTSAYLRGLSLPKPLAGRGGRWSGGWGTGTPQGAAVSGVAGFPAGGPRGKALLGRVCGSMLEERVDLEALLVREPDAFPGVRTDEGDGRTEGRVDGGRHAGG